MQRRAALRLLIRTRGRRPTWHIAPDLSLDQRNDVAAFGRQIITLIACALFIVGGYLSGHVEAGYRAAWYSFAFGALWVSFVDDPFRFRRPRAPESPRPFEPPVP